MEFVCRYFKFEPQETLKTSLQEKKIIEYPSIHVVLGEPAKEYRLLNVDGDSSSSEESSDDSESESESSSDSELEMVESKSQPKSTEPPWDKLLDPQFGKV